MGLSGIPNRLNIQNHWLFSLFIISSRACCKAKGEALRYCMHGNENVRNCILKQ